jgi:hypothetical protein
MWELIVKADGREVTSAIPEDHVDLQRLLKFQFNSDHDPISLDFGLYRSRLL